MIFNATREHDASRAREKLDRLIEGRKRFELTEKKPIRSLAQNSYLHLILAAFAMEFGYTLDEVKQVIFKQVVNTGLFYDGEYGQKVKIQRWRSTADLDKSEMTMAIERFKNYSATEAGLYLPEPSDLVYLEEIQERLSNYDINNYL